MKLALNSDWNNYTPLYIQLANKLRDSISEGQITSGEALPSERALSEITGTSRVTIRKAIDQLVEEGLLERRHGSGTFITAQLEQAGTTLSGFSADAIHRGQSPKSIWLVKTVSSATADEAMVLAISPATQVARLARVRLADDEPLAIEHAIVPLSLLPPMDTIGDSLYAALERQGNKPVQGIQKIRASLATPIEAGLLSIREGAEVLRIERRTFLADGTPVELTRSAYRGDHYEFVADLRECVDYR
ncbi:GntR family transcriptional regulator [Niveispirillum lacus]|uniref:GntR family transcriptional regulator n=1 Tax=Niveispirillum lacus TaxID=1981099 RepID=A0A255Z8B1_9PROT|nr:GntR family transcriptional regulator [Niveispirillum lacus]OYQ37793.1 GntR family transcriptional regulator [Niveispirillum lacus]